MFTGLIQETGKLLQASARSSGVQLRIHAPGIVADSDVGDSIACNGVCLTIERLTSDSFETHAGAETMRHTTLQSWRSGQLINLETALRPSDRLGGHFVQGHVDCVGICTSRRPEGETVHYSFDIRAEQMIYVVEKGSIAVDGISLTVTAATDSGFSVAIIPHTMAKTTLPRIKAGDEVNVELDILAKYVRRSLASADAATAQPGGGITEQFLRENGFIS